jgi:hypothetical protein
MTAPIKTYRKTSIERRRLYLDYSCWLEATEVLSSFQVTVVPFTSDAPMAVATSYPDTVHKRLMMYVSGGKANQNYTLQMVINTDQGQVKQDNIGIMVVP